MRKWPTGLPEAGHWPNMSNKVKSSSHYFIVWFFRAYVISTPHTVSCPSLEQYVRETVDSSRCFGTESQHYKTTKFQQ